MHANGSNKIDARDFFVLFKIIEGTFVDDDL